MESKEPTEAPLSRGVRVMALAVTVTVCRSSFDMCFPLSSVRRMLNTNLYGYSNWRGFGIGVHPVHVIPGSVLGDHGQHGTVQPQGALAVRVLPITAPKIQCEIPLHLYVHIPPPIGGDQAPDQIRTC